MSDRIDLKTIRKDFIREMNEVLNSKEPCHKCEQLLAENKELSTALAEAVEWVDEYFSQHRCGCGHPACKLCRRDNELVAFKREVDQFLKGEVDDE